MLTWLSSCFSLAIEDSSSSLSPFGKTDGHEMSKGGGFRMALPFLDPDSRGRGPGCTVLHRERALLTLSKVASLSAKFPPNLFLGGMDITLAGLV